MGRGVDSPPERFKRMSSSPHVSSARKTARFVSPAKNDSTNHSQRLKCMSSSSDPAALENNVTGNSERAKAIDRPRARKQIRFEGTTEDAENDTSTREGILKLMSIDAVRRAEKQKVKVIIPRGDSFSIRTPSDALTAAMIRNLCNKN